MAQVESLAEQQAEGSVSGRGDVDDVNVGGAVGAVVAGRDDIVVGDGGGGGREC